MGRRIERSRDWHVGPRSAFMAGAVLWGVAVLGVGGLQAADAGKSSPDRRAQGRELFEREWLPGDSRTHGGDGLGPVFNDSSCIACHNLGGNGGAGPASKNVDIISASPNGQMIQQQSADPAIVEPSPASWARRRARWSASRHRTIPDRARRTATDPPGPGSARRLGGRSTPDHWSRPTPASGRRGAWSSTASARNRATRAGGSR